MLDIDEIEKLIKAGKEEVEKIPFEQRMLMQALIKSFSESSRPLFAHWEAARRALDKEDFDNMFVGNLACMLLVYNDIDGALHMLRKCKEGLAEVDKKLNM